MAKQAVKTPNAKLVKASARGLHISPRKMRLVTNLVKDMPVAEAITQLEFTNKKAAEFLIKVLKSAVANAQNNHSLEPDNLFVKSITADMGATMKRYFPRARGSAFVIRRKLSAVNVVLEERKVKKAKKSRISNLLKRTRTEKEPVVKENPAGEPEAITESNIEGTTQNKPAAAPRSSDQIKMNKAQNKRRLFNRRTGE